MEVLTGDTLAEALLFCSQQENVSVCVVLDNMRNTKELVETLWREIELGNLPGWVMQRGFDVASLNTKKSSALYFITAYDARDFKGRTFNRILYLSDLNTVILSEIERYEQPLRFTDGTYGGEELDDFLSGFKIKPAASAVRAI